MTLTLAAERPEVDPLGDADRRVVLDDPGVDAVKPESLERERQHRRNCARGVAAAGVRFVAEHDPQRRAPEVGVHAAQSDDADRQIAVVAGEQSQDDRAALHGDFQPRGADQLAAVAEIEPLVVFLARQPLHHERQLLRIVRR
jgi:hypothetical protein